MQLKTVQINPEISLESTKDYPENKEGIRGRAEKTEIEEENEKFLESINQRLATLYSKEGVVKISEFRDIPKVANLINDLLAYIDFLQNR